MTYEQFCKKIKLQYVAGWSGDTSIRKYVDQKMGIEKEIVTERKVAGDIYGGWKPQKVYYFITGDERTFRSPKTLWNAYKRKKKC